MLNRKGPWRRWPAGLIGALAGLAVGGEAISAERPSCQTVRLADIGWTDVTATTAIAAELLSRLGYTPKIVMLSVPVAYYSMKNKDIDVFLGNWMPSMAADRQPFIDDHSVDVVRANLSGAKYTLATPAYAYEAGLTDFKDIQRFAAPLRNSIYGIEPGNDGNRLVLQMLRQGEFGLGGFRLIESSERGMLAEVERAYRAKRPIVFLGWQPHLMNQRFDMRYLSGGDSVFGPDFGSAKVFTNARAGYVKDCPNVGRLLNNLAFTIDGETEMMGDILERKMSPSAAAKSWLDAHPTALRGWLAGVTTFGGGPPHLTAQASPDAREGSFQQWVEGHKIPVGVWIATAMEGLKAHSGAFDFASSVIRSAVDGLTALLCTVPPPLAILALAALAWAIKRSWPLAILVGLTFLFILNQGYWAATLETLSLVLFSTLVVMVIGVPVGIACAHHPRLAAALRPVLDLMQTLPAFVYLIPALVLFGLGVVPGLISTVIFALPAPIRTTQLGVASTPRTLREAAVAFGATPWQLLLKVELPSALPQIAAGLTQSIMLSLSMVVIAALVGAGGLGVPVVRALNTVQVGMGFEAGLAIVLLAIILDRVSRPRQAGASS